MANLLLFMSSCIVGIIHLFFIIILQSTNLLLNTNIIFGIITSIINHGSNSLIAKWCDRFMMLIGIYIDIIIIYSYNCYYSCLFLLLSILSFIISKYIMCYFYHIISHILLTITHIIMLFTLAQ